MTKEETVAHWQRGASGSLKLAKLAHQEGEYALALFHCHLAVEKGLKAVFILEKNGSPPPTHDLLSLAARLALRLEHDDETALSDLTEYAVAARYDDIAWAQQEATKSNSAHWIAESERLLLLLQR